MLKDGTREATAKSRVVWIMADVCPLPIAAESIYFWNKEKYGIVYFLPMNEHFTWLELFLLKK